MALYAWALPNEIVLDLLKNKSCLLVNLWIKTLNMNSWLAASYFKGMLQQTWGKGWVKLGRQIKSIICTEGWHCKLITWIFSQKPYQHFGGISGEWTLKCMCFMKDLIIYIAFRILHMLIHRRNLLFTYKQTPLQIIKLVGKKIILTSSITVTPAKLDAIMT